MPRSNIFEAGTASIADLFEDYLEAAPESGACIALALSEFSLGDDARNAIEKSLAALDFGEKTCTYATTHPRGTVPDGPHTGQLDAQALFMLVEGLDPLCVIAADAHTVASLGKAYRTDFETDAAIRVFGRSSVAFENLEDLLGTEAGKQKAWFLFKSLARR